MAGFGLPLALALTCLAASAARGAGGPDADQDGIDDPGDSCPAVLYAPAFDVADCPAPDGDLGNDPRPECRARERVVQMLINPGDGALITHIAFAIVRDGQAHCADAFTYLGNRQFAHDPAGIHRLYRTGSTTKSIVAATAMILQEQGELSLGDFVSDDDASQVPANGERTLRQLLAHQGAFAVDNGAIHLFCHPGDLAQFWAEPDDLVSPHYDSPPYGNLGGGFQYSAFNYSLAGAYLANRTGEPFAQLLQTRVFDPVGMCTAMLDGARAAGTPIGEGPAVSQSPVMVVGPYINLVSQADRRCVDNFYSSDDLPGDPFSWQYYRLDEAASEARDPAGGVIASVIDLAQFARALLASYHAPGGLLSQAGVRELWAATSDLGCFPACPYERYYGLGFFTATLSGQPVTRVEHGGSRPGHTSAFVLRPEAGLAACILANADVSTVTISQLAETILDDVESFCAADLDGNQSVGIADFLALLGAWGTAGPGAAIAPPFATVDVVDFLELLAAWGACG
jgi:CubicO group peptidase (beta-lactamase class C family)